MHAIGIAIDSSHYLRIRRRVRVIDIRLLTGQRNFQSAIVSPCLQVKATLLSSERTPLSSVPSVDIAMQLLRSASTPT